MDSNDFFVRNATLLALVESEDHPQSKEEILDEILASYDHVNKEQVLKHMDEFSSREEIEHYVHSLAVHNNDRPEWE